MSKVEGEPQSIKPKNKFISSLEYEEGNEFENTDDEYDYIHSKSYRELKEELVEEIQNYLITYVSTRYNHFIIPMCEHLSVKEVKMLLREFEI